MIKSALIGYGYWGQILGRKLNDSDSFDLRIIGDLKFEKSFEQKSITYSNDVHKILEDPQIAVIFIATPPHSHVALARQALMHGKHVWLEKPGTTSVTEYNQLALVAQQNHCKLYVDFIVLFEPWLVHLKQQMLLKSQNKGHQDKDHLEDIKVLAVRETLDRISTSKQKTQGHVEENPLDLLYDLAIHDLSVLKFLFPQLRAEHLELKTIQPDECFIGSTGAPVQLDTLTQSSSRYGLELNTVSNLSLEFKSLQVKIYVDRQAQVKCRYFQIGSDHYYFLNQTQQWQHCKTEALVSVSADKQNAGEQKSTGLSLEDCGLVNKNRCLVDSLELSLFHFNDLIHQRKAVDENMEIAQFVHQVLEKCK